MTVVATETLIAAIVVTYNSSSTIEECVRSILACDAQPERVGGNLRVDVVVVDNTSHDATITKVQAFENRVHLIASGHNVGLAAGNNCGMSSSPKADAFLICNPDTVLHPGAVAALADCLRRNSKAAFVVPKILNVDGSMQPCVGAMVSLRVALRGHSKSMNGGGGADSDSMWWSGWSHDVERQVPRGLEACYLVRASAVAEVGMQDPRYFLDWEGPDWTRRMTEAGWEVWFTPEAQVTHIGGVSIRQAKWRGICYSHRGMYLYFADRAPAWQRVLLAVTISVRGAFKTAVAWAKDRGA